MQTASHSSAPPRPASWPMYRALVGVGVACGLLIVSVYVLTLPVIARNEAEALQKADKCFDMLILPNGDHAESDYVTKRGWNINFIHRQSLLHPVL